PGTSKASSKEALPQPLIFVGTCPPLKPIGARHEPLLTVSSSTADADHAPPISMMDFRFPDSMTSTNRSGTLSTRSNSHAAPVMISIPAALTASCSQAPLVYCVRIQCAENDRKTPRQKIGSECRPHRMSGCSHFDVSGFHSCETKYETIVASARKCVRRSMSRSVLSIG